MADIYYAHSGNKPDGRDWQPLKHHLEGVALLAGDRAKAFHAKDLGYLVGLLHDLGKYTGAFQARLHGSSSRTDHATAGAKLVIDHIVKTLGPEYAPLGKLLAFTIAGHHAGLANGVDDGKDRSTLKQRLALAFDQDIPALDEVWHREIELPKSLAMPSLKTHQPVDKYKNFGFAFLTRMLFSCLIDSDRIDTENYTRRISGLTPLSVDYPILNRLQEQLNLHLQQVAKNANPTDVNTLRQSVLHYAREQAFKPRESGLYSLTVPTGGGKTLTSLAFGLDHAVKHQLRRVIYVIPFTSVIEQTADVFRRALGDCGNAVLEHHSAYDRDRLPGELYKADKPRQADYRDKLRLAMESWDAPLIVTTAVQFFESLFSDRPTQCRKLHNIAGSVIVLDEAQTLPLKLLRPIMAAIDELALNYGCSVVLCTATQPALKHSDNFHNGFQNVREIAPDPPQLFQKLQRTQVRFIGEQSDDQLVGHLRRNEQVLMIVNNRRHARALFDAIAGEEGAYHLTTSMCAEHRSQKLAEIRLRLQGGHSCRLVATSLIEAGVDVDFPKVYRAEAGLDSIAQAAGRCNREGRRLPENSHVLVFQSPEWAAPPELAQLAAPMRSILRNHPGDVLAPEALRAYFQQVYTDKGSDLDHHQILKKIRDAESCDFPFQSIANAFRMIESHMVPIIVPFDDVAAENIRLLHQLPENMSVGKIAQKLQRYVVQVPDRAFLQLLEIGAIEAIASNKFGNQFYVLAITELWYSTKAGLDWDPMGLKDTSAIIF